MFNEIDFTKIDLTGQPPADETKRQYYFMGKIRELLARESAVLGRPVTYCLQTFGCQMNPATMMA